MDEVNAENGNIATEILVMKFCVRKQGFNRPIPKKIIVVVTGRDMEYDAIDKLVILNYPVYYIINKIKNQKLFYI